MALLAHRSIEEAATAAGASAKTLHRWLKEPEFDTAYRAAKRAAFGQAIARLHQGSSAAATTLLKLMLDPATPPSTRARCAESVLSLAGESIDREEIESRLAALERALESSKQKR